MINAKTRKETNPKKELSFFKSDMFSLKVVKIRPVFLLLFLLGLMFMFYFAILNPDFIFSIITGIALFAAGFIVSNIFYLNASGKREDIYNRLITRHSSDMFVIFKIADGRFKYASQALEKLLGYDLSSIVNQYDLSFVHPADRFDFYNILDKNFLRLNRSFSNELRMIKRDGTIIWINIKGDVIVDASNDMEYVILNFRDITNEMEQLIALKQYQKGLEQSIEKLTQQKESITKIKPIQPVQLEKIDEEKFVLDKKKFQPALTFRKLKLNI